jgi:ABC-type glycerol-3-phosphate transport system substrate-binding protein
MRKTTSLIVALVMLAGCGGSSETAASDPAPEARAVAESATTAVPTTTPAAMDAKVVFDGEACSYVGPAIVPDGTTVAFEFEATAKPDAIAMVVGGVEPGTTWEQYAEWADRNAAGSPPPFGTPDYRILLGPGSLSVELHDTDYVVNCATSPSDTNENFAAAFIEVSET